MGPGPGSFLFRELEPDMGLGWRSAQESQLSEGSARRVPLAPKPGSQGCDGQRKLPQERTGQGCRREDSRADSQDQGSVFGPTE